MINLINFSPMNSELGNSAYCFKQVWNEGGKALLSATVLLYLDH